MITKTIEVEASLFDKLEVLIAAEQPVEGMGENDMVFLQSATFSNSIEMDIKIVNSMESPWTEGVLLEHGCEVGCTDVGESLAGEYIVEFEGTEYCTIVRKGDA